MKNETIEKIIMNSSIGKNTIIGKYAYKADLNTGEIKRCKTTDIKREWVDMDGKIFSGWEVV